MGERVNIRRRSRKRPRKRILLAAALILLLIMALWIRGDRKGEYIGTYDMSHYCLEQWDGYHICGNSAYGCGGDRLVPGKSLAVPKSVLAKYPVGTKVLLQYPDGRKEKLIIHDTGRALERLDRVDMPVNTHQEALNRGVIEGVELYTLK